MNSFTKTIKGFSRASLVMLSLIGGLASLAALAPSEARADSQLFVSCNANPSNAYVGDSVTYYATATGGNSAYSYTWANGDALYGTGSSISRTYSYVGQQYMTVRVTSDSMTQSATCYTNVTQRPYGNGGNYGQLSGSCFALPTNANTGDNVNWMTQNVTGGNGSYTYYWTGTDGLTSTSQTAYKTYSYGGTKYASVTISSGDGQSYTASCSPINVNGSSNGNWNNGTLGVTCYASPSQANLYDAVTWYASVTGGNGYYTYNWTGTDGLTGTGQNVTRMYPSLGYKTASVTVYSNGQSVSNSCSMNVGSTAYNNGNNYYNGTYYGTGYYPGSTYYPTTYQNPSTVTVIQAPPTTTYVPTYSNPAYANPVSGVFLNRLPSTGISLGLKMTLFALGMLIWSAFAAFMITQRKERLAVSKGPSTLDRIAAFKESNKARRGIR